MYHNYIVQPKSYIPIIYIKFITTNRLEKCKKKTYDFSLYNSSKLKYCFKSRNQQFETNVTKGSCYKSELCQNNVTVTFQIALK